MCATCLHGNTEYTQVTIGEGWDQGNNDVIHIQGFSHQYNQAENKRPFLQTVPYLPFGSCVFLESFSIS